VLQAKSINPSFNNLAFLITQHLREVILDTFYQKRASFVKHADLKDMFKKASESVCTSTVKVSSDLCHLLHHSLQLPKPQKRQKWILMTLDQQMKETSK
jgi:hypothetical protein